MSEAGLLEIFQQDRFVRLFPPTVSFRSRLERLKSEINLLAATSSDASGQMQSLQQSSHHSAKIRAFATNVVATTNTTLEMAQNRQSPTASHDPCLASGPCFGPPKTQMIAVGRSARCWSQHQISLVSKGCILVSSSSTHSTACNPFKT